MTMTKKNTAAKLKMLNNQTNNGLQTLKDCWGGCPKSPPSMPYRGREIPGPPRHERREYLWISVPPRRLRLGWEAVQRC